MILSEFIRITLTELENSFSESEMSLVVMTSDMGWPLPSGLPRVMMSGTTSVADKHSTVRQDSTCPGSILMSQDFNGYP